MGCIARLTFVAGGFAEGVTTTFIVCVAVSVMDVDVVVEVNEAAAVSEEMLGAKRVLAGFLEGEGGSEKWIVDRGLVAGFTRVEAAEATDLATDLARGLRLDFDRGLAGTVDGSTMSTSSSSSDEGARPVLTLLDVLDRVRTLLWLAPESDSESSESASTALRERLRETEPWGSWHLSRAHEVSLSS